jgi:hypothetical protein
MKPLEFSSVFVFESLRPGDIKTGASLFNDTIRPRMMQKGLEGQCELITITSKADFFNALGEIYNQIIYKLVNPVIHLEMHGSKDGLQVTNGEVITWQELQIRLIEMNGLTENNLFVSLATCYGGYIYTVISPRLRTPFWGFIGPFEQVDGDEVLANYTAFYDEFLFSNDFAEAEKALHNSNPNIVSKFRLQNTEFVFAKAYKNYEEKYLTPAMVEHRTNLIAAQCKDMPEFKGWTIVQMKKMAKKIMVDHKQKLKEDLMSKFFMWDLFPHQKP